MKSRMNSSNFKPMKKHASSKSKEAQNNLKTIAQLVVLVFQYNIGYCTKKRKEFWYQAQSNFDTKFETKRVWYQNWWQTQKKGNSHTRHKAILKSILIPNSIPNKFDTIDTKTNTKHKRKGILIPGTKLFWNYS